MQRLTNKVNREFNRQNSRVSFGTFLFEAARQGDWQNLQLILDQKGGEKHLSCTSTATPTLTPLLQTHTTHMLMIMYLHNKSWCSYTSLFPHCSCGPYRPHRQIWTGTDWYVHKPTVISRQQLVRESDVGEQYRAIDTWLCLYNYWLCRSILYSLCCCIVALQMSVVPAVLCPLCQLSIFPFKISSFLSLVITFCHLSPDSAHSSCW